MSSHASTGATRSWAIQRSVTLLRVFLLASAVILISGAVALGAVLTGALRAQALQDTRTSLTEYVDGVLRPQLVRDDRIHVSPHLPSQIDEQLRRQPDLVSVKVWRPDGVLVWTNRAPERIGRRFSLEGELGATIGENQAHASIGSSTTRKALPSGRPSTTGASSRSTHRCRATMASAPSAPTRSMRSRSTSRRSSLRASG